MNAGGSYKERKLDYQQQIERLEDYGVQFDLISRDEAITFLSRNSYYAKLRSYLHSFEKYQEPERSHRCIHVDFKHLMELSRLDMHLRKQIISLSLDIEHAMKTLLIQLLTDDPKCDGYSLIKQYFTPATLEQAVAQATHSAYTYLIAERFEQEANIWNLIELLSFSRFMSLFEAYSNDHARQWHDDYGLMRCARFLRNAAAHNNSLLHNLYPADKTYQHEKSKYLSSYLSNTLRMKSNHRKRLLDIPVWHDLAASLVLLSQRASIAIAEHRFDDFQKFFNYFHSQRDLFSRQLHLQNQIDGLVHLMNQLREYGLLRRQWEE